MNKQSTSLENVYIAEAASIVGKKEGEGPLAKCFDTIMEDATFGEKTWEEAEGKLQLETAQLLLYKAQLQARDIKYIFAGDLLGQLIATFYGLSKLNIPLFGIYGACSTFAEGISLGAMAIDGGHANNVIALASSHFASAEKTFRFPLGYGNQRPLCSTWTVTGCGAVLLNNSEGCAKITGITTGKIVDYGLKDNFNMGACMAPAAMNVIESNLQDFNINSNHYDKIITGDLGYVGKDILLDLLKRKGIDISMNYMDCGIEIYNKKTQDTHSGGSGCGCSAVTFASYILKQIKSKAWKKVLFIPTGALISPVSFNEGNTVPGIAHGIVVEAV